MAAQAAARFMGKVTETTERCSPGHLRAGHVENQSGQQQQGDQTDENKKENFHDADRGAAMGAVV
jgi:hypothetical protein